jgi:hypothetical protein
MAESISITWNIKLVIGERVTTRFPIKLENLQSHWGSIEIYPPAQLTVPAGQKEASISFIATDSRGTASGSEGQVTYASVGSPVKFDFYWNIPYSKDHSTNVQMSMQSDVYKVETSKLSPASAKSVTVNVTIRQIGPTS